MPESLSVLVIGASIAGPHAAYWLWRAGAEVTVIERYPGPRRGGQNVDIRAVGVTIIRRAPGLEAAIKNNLHTLDGMRLVDTNGNAIATMTSTGNAEEQSFLSEYEIYRDRLSEILCDMTRNKTGVRYIYGEQVSAIRHEADSTVVEFANGTPTQSFDLVVACDGASSRTRAIGYDCAVQDHIEPVNAWAAYFSIPEDMLNGSTIAHAHTSVGGRFISLEPDAGFNGNRVMLMSIHRSTDVAALDAFREAQQGGETAIKNHAVGRFKGSGWLSDEILHHMLKCEDFYASGIVQVKVPHLHRNRLVLVGDAGYCVGPTGMGTSLALTGGYILSGELVRHRGDVKAALQAYQHTMQPMIREYQQIPRGVPGFMAPQTEREIYWRNLAFRLLCWALSFGPWFSWLGKCWADAFGGGEKFSIPQYEWPRDKEGTMT